MGVHPHLPIQGIDIILGNDLAGDRVWKDGPPWCLGSLLHESGEPDDWRRRLIGLIDFVQLLEKFMRSPSLIVIQCLAWRTVLIR